MGIARSRAAGELTQFLDAVAAADDEATAVRSAVGLASETCTADSTAVLDREGVVVAGEPPGAADLETLTIPIGDERLESLVLARAAGPAFSAGDVDVARAMATILGQTVRALRLAASERRLREVVDRLSREDAVHQAFHDS